MEDVQQEAAHQPVMARDELQRLIAEANAGSEPARARLRDWLDATPEAWRSVGDLGAHSEAAVREKIAGQDYLHAECLRRSAEALRKSLLAEDASVIEQLSVQRLVVCWLQLQLADMRLAAADGSTARSSFSIRAAESAQRRFTSAMSQWQALQKLLGRPVCRAAIEKVLTETGPSSLGGKAHSQAGGQPTAAPSMGKESALNSRESPSQSSTQSPEHAGPPAPDQAVELSGIVPFRIGRPSKDQQGIRLQSVN
jgi:hypothetical protein